MDKTIVKGFSVLEYLASKPQPCGITEISQALGMNKSNVHRIVSTLIALEYVYQDPETSRYGATLRTWEIGARVHARVDVRREAIPILHDLSSYTTETVDLVVRSGLEVVFLESIESSHVVRAFSRYGSRAPCWCTAAGKILLAYEPDDVIRALPKKFETFTATTISDRGALAKELKVIRDRGYSISRGELVDSVWSLGVPVRRSGETPVAAITFSAPSERFKKRDIQEDARRFLLAASELSRKLGYIDTRTE